MVLGAEGTCPQAVPSNPRLHGTGAGAMPDHSWIPILPGRFVRPTGDGQFELKKEMSIKPQLERNQERCREAAVKPSSAETDTGSMRRVAAYPVDVLTEVQDKCGGDPEKEQMFLRDNPQWLTIPRNQANLPPKRIYIFPK